MSADIRRIFWDPTSGTYMTEDQSVLAGEKAMGQRNDWFSGDEFDGDDLFGDGALFGDGDEVGEEFDGDDEVGESFDGDDEVGGRGKGKAKRKWARTALGGSAAITAAGSWSIQIRTQHTFVAEDVTTAGTTATSSTLVKTISFGDREVFNSTSGIPYQNFDSSSYARGWVKGHGIRGGLDITVSGTTSSTSGTVFITFNGRKPANCN